MKKITKVVVISIFLLINNILRSKKNQQVYTRYFLILAHKTQQSEDLSIFKLLQLPLHVLIMEKKPKQNNNKLTSSSFTHFLAKIVLIHVSSPVGTHSTDCFFVIVSVLRKKLLTVIKI